MAEFFGKVKGSHGAVTRLGTKSSGLETVAASWSGAVRVQLNKRADGQVAVLVELVPWMGAGTYRILYDGPISPEAGGGLLPLQTSED